MKSNKPLVVGLNLLLKQMWDLNWLPLLQHTQQLLNHLLFTWQNKLDQVLNTQP